MEKYIEEFKKLEELLEKECPKYENSCNGCPFKKECEKYQKLYAEINN